MKTEKKAAFSSIADDDNFFNTIMKKNFSGVGTANEQLENHLNDKQDKSNTVISIDPNTAHNWSYPDRPKRELKDLTSLGVSMKENGQAAPCIARLAKNSNQFTYEIIVGERRWRAAKEVNIPLDIIIKDISDEAATFIQIAENLHREDLSDYARGISLATFIKANLITQREYSRRFNTPKNEVHRLLSYSKLPKKLIDSIGTMENVSPRTSEEIVAILNKDPELLDRIIQLSDKLRTGKLGANKLRQLVTPINKNNEEKKPFTEIKNGKGKTLFTIKVVQSNKIEIGLPNKEQRGSLDKIKQCIEDSLISQFI